VEEGEEEEEEEEDERSVNMDRNNWRKQMPFCFRRLVDGSHHFSRELEINYILHTRRYLVSIKYHRFSLRVIMSEKEKLAPSLEIHLL